MFLVSRILSSLLGLSYNTCSDTWSCQPRKLSNIHIYILVYRDRNVNLLSIPVCYSLPMSNNEQKKYMNLTV
jgi:hypothetical protein